jgi:hypothetical protein
VFGEDRLEVRMHRGCLNFLNGMELGNSSLVTFFEELFHSMGTDDLKGAYCDALELIPLSLLLELHGVIPLGRTQTVNVNINEHMYIRW